MNIENVDQGFKFFAELPDLTTTAEQSETPRTDMIGIIPVFKDVYFNERNFPAFMKSAIYCRQSWLLHTDAQETDTAIKLYIDDTCKDIAVPMCKANGLNIETDIIWFHAEPLPDTHEGIWARLGKKMNLYWDPQLADYDKVLYWDADMFKLPAPDDVEHNIFTQVAVTERVLSFIKSPLRLRRLWRPHMLRSTVKNIRFGGLPLQDIFERAELGRALQEITGPIAYPIGGLGIYPAKRFHTQVRPFVEWQKAYAPYIGDDEICIALGAAKFNVYLRSLTETPEETRGEEWYVDYATVHEYIQNEGEGFAMIHGKANEADMPHYRKILESITKPT